MAKLRLPTVLRPLANGTAVLDVAASDLASLGVEIRGRYPALAERMYGSDGSWRDFVNVFVDGEDARYLDGGTPIGSATEIQLLPAVSGGSA